MPLAYLGELHYHHVVDPRRLVAAGLRARRDLEDEMMFDLIKYTLYKLHLIFFYFNHLFSAGSKWPPNAGLYSCTVRLSGGS